MLEPRSLILDAEKLFTMKLPWQNDQEKQELKNRLEELEEEKQKWKNKYEAEEERRKKLSTKKQQLDKQIKELKDKLRNKEETEEQQEAQKTGYKSLGFDQAVSLLEKLSTVRGDNLVTVYCPGKLSEFSELKELKNSVSKQLYRELEGEEGFVAFIDEELGGFMLKTRSFFSEKLVLEDRFETQPVQSFIEKEKQWAIVSAGETRVIEERNGEVEELEVLKSRIDREHSKGGFSQGRFERKREEQVEEHLDNVEEVLNGLNSEPFLLGDERLCKQLSGRFLGGFDSNASMLRKLYGFRLKRF